MKTRMLLEFNTQILLSYRKQAGFWIGPVRGGVWAGKRLASCRVGIGYEGANATEGIRKAGESLRINRHIPQIASLLLTLPGTVLDPHRPDRFIMTSQGMHHVAATLMPCSPSIPTALPARVELSAEHESGSCVRAVAAVSGGPPVSGRAPKSLPSSSNVVGAYNPHVLLVDLHLVTWAFSSAPPCAFLGIGRA
jgi:hypothetical protein